MSNKCLVTELKGEVNNNNLPYFDCLRYYSEGNKRFRVSNGLGAVLKISDGTLTVSNVSGSATWDSVNKTVTYNTNQVVDVTFSGSGNFIVDGKYREMEVRSLDAGIEVHESIKYVGYQSLKEFRLSVEDVYIPDTMKVISIIGADADHHNVVHVGDELVELHFGSMVLDTPLDMSEIEQISSLKKFTIFVTPGSGITTSTAKELTGLTELTLSTNDIRGEVSDLSTLVNLTSFIARGSAITGDLKDMFDGLYDNGKTSGTLYVNVNSPIKYNGVVPSSAFSVVFSAGGWSEVQ